MNWSCPAFEFVAALVGSRSGLVFPPDRREGVELGIRRAMARAKIADPERYRCQIGTSESLFDDLLDELTVGETYFFREPAQFEYIRREILPEIRQGRNAEHPIRVWSAGCASGEEAYSLAMLFADEGLLEQTRLLATDISRDSLTRAREASYRAWSLRGEGAKTARRHLVPRGDCHVVAEPIRRRVAFEHLNLALDIYPSITSGTRGMDLILCRNVLIYFDGETVRGVANRLYASLAEGGWLMTASTDPPLREEAPFEPVMTDYGMFYRRGAPRVAHAVPIVLAGPAEPAPRVEEPQSPAPVAADPLEAILVAARVALSEGDYASAAEQTRPYADDAGASALHIRAMANLDASIAERACVESLARHPLSCELHYLWAVLLLGLGRDDEAARAAQRVLYLDRSLAIAHFLLGAIQSRRGDQKGAWRSFRNARDLCETRPADETVPLSDDEPAGRLVESARAQMSRLDALGLGDVRR